MGLLPRPRRTVGVNSGATEAIHGGSGARAPRATGLLVLAALRVSWDVPVDPRWLTGVGAPVPGGRPQRRARWRARPAALQAPPLDEEIHRAGMRGNVASDRPRRHRSTRRRQDAPALPRRKVDPRTVGKTYTTPDGKVFRPSMFLTLTCPSYGRVTARRHPGRPGQLRLRGGPRGTRCTSPRCSTGSGRTCAAPSATTSSTSPPSNPNAVSRPHVHFAIRGTVPRTELREVIAATYHQVWWPPPTRSASTATSCRSGTRPAPTTSTRRPAKSCPPGTRPSTPSTTTTSRCTSPGSATRFDAQGVLAGSRDADRCIGYLTKYLTKQVADCHQARHRRPAARTPTGSPRRCATSRARRPARTGSATASSPRTPGRACGPARCKGKAHRREYLGFGGRRVLVSRKWSGKTLADHRADRKAWLIEMLGLPATDPARYTWELVEPGDQDHMPTGQRLLHVVADRMHWLQALDQARRRAQGLSEDLSATGRAA